MHKQSWILSFVLIASCTPPAGQEAKISSVSLQETEQKTHSSSLFSHQRIPSCWWHILEDKQLTTLIEQGLNHNPSLQAVEETLAAAKARTKIAKSRFFPTLDFNAEDSWDYLSKYGLLRNFFPTLPGTAVPAKYNEIDLSLQFSYELDFFGKNQKRFQASMGEVFVKEWEKNLTKLIISTSIAFAYFSWQAHGAELALISQELIIQKERILLSSHRYEQGIDRVTHLLEEKKLLDNLQQRHERIVKESVLDELFLKTWLGQGPDDPLALTFTWNPEHYQAFLPSELSLDIVSRRPDLMAQLWRIDVARQEVGVAKAAFYPNVNLLAFAGLSSLTFSHLFSWASRTGSLNPAIHLPLFTGGELTGQLEEKVARFQEAVYCYNQKLLEAAQEVVAEITTYQTIDQQLQEELHKISSQKELVMTAGQRKEQGIDNGLILLKENKDLSFLEEELVMLQHERICSLLRLIKSLGGGFDNHD